MIDLIIKNGTVIDGTGGSRFQADVAVDQGRIVAVGAITESAKETVDATGKIVAPGFIDVHTHYDAQVFWDPTLSPSLYHGVTTVVAGNCGFTLAPLSDDPADGEYLKRMLSRVEGMPLASLNEGIPWGTWKSFDDYLKLLDGKLAINAGFMVGHCALRRTVMGERAVGNEATPDELEKMKSLLGESLAAGGLGFSTTISVTHNDLDSNPVPSRYATMDEFYAFAEVIKEHPGTVIEFLPKVGKFTEEQYSLLTNMSLKSQRPVNWNLLNPQSQRPDVTEAQLGASDYARERGAMVIALTVPQTMKIRVNLTSGFIFDALHQWAEVIGKPLEERKRLFADPEVRQRLKAGAAAKESGAFRKTFDWPRMTIHEVFNKENKPYEGMLLGEYAEKMGKDPFDAFLDLSISEDLKTSFMPHLIGDDEESWKARGAAWHDPRTVVGASDAGAHLDMLDTFAFSTQILGNGVRKRNLITTEEAVHQLTSIPAKLWGIKKRGLLKEGYHADLVVFDEETIDCGPTYTRHDLPSNEARLYADAIGVEHVFVNGNEIVRGQEFTGAYAGKILRSGQDTETVLIPAASETS